MAGGRRIMNIFKSCKKTITYLVILSMVVAGVVPTSFVKAEEENTLENTTEDSLIYKNIKVNVVHRLIFNWKRMEHCVLQVRER